MLADELASLAARLSACSTAQGLTLFAYADIQRLVTDLREVTAERDALKLRVAELEAERDDARNMAKEFLEDPPQPEDWRCLSRRYDWWDSV